MRQTHRYSCRSEARRILASLAVFALMCVNAVAGEANQGPLASALASGQATPMAAIAADLDADGAADVVAAFSSPAGPMLAIFRGNPDRIHPNHPEAGARRATGQDAGAFARVEVAALPFEADFVAAVDLDMDGRLDVAAARRGDDRLAILRGLEDGTLAAAELESFGAGVTALASADLAPRDGYADLAVAVSGETGHWLALVRAGALDADPAWVQLPGEARALATGAFGPEGRPAIAAAVGSDVLLVSAETLEVIARGSAGAEAIALAARSAAGEPSEQVVALTANGRIVTLREAGGELAETASVSGPWTGDARLVIARHTGGPADDVVVATAERVDLVPSLEVEAKTALGEPERLETRGGLVVALRAGEPALSDLAVVTGDAMPAIVPAARRATFTVTTPDDSGPGTLRDAILNANANPGPDTIVFGIAGTDFTIDLASPLPAVTQPTTIDATTQPGFSGVPIVELNGAGAGASANGLVLSGGSSVVRGLIVNGFSANGIVLLGGSGNVVEGNYIGTNRAGTAAVPNAGDGVLIRGSATNIVGGAAAAARNVISGNGSDGVQIDTAGATSNTILGNYIGTSANGAADVGNTGDGVLVSTAAASTTIGGTAAGQLNVISGNGGSGVEVEAGAGANTLVAGNRIGVAAGSLTGIANGGSGVLIGASTTSVSTNIIASNTGDGVLVLSGTGNLVTRNSIHSNGGLGIDLAPDGATPNDTGDPDTGANTLQNRPVITAAAASGSSSVVQGTLNSTPSSTFTIELFSNTACDPSGFGEGQTFVGQTTVTTDASGNASFSVTVPVNVTTNQSITATATGPGNNTSEFSNCVTIEPSADLSVNKSASAASVPAGQQVVYTVVVTNAGPIAAQDVVLFDGTPSGTTFVSATTSNGSCETPPPGGTGAITCSLGTLAAGATATVTIRVTIDAPPGLTIVNTAFVTSSTPDPNLDNNTDTVETLVIEAPIITAIVRRNTETFSLQIRGDNFQPGVQVFIGNDTTPWPNVKYKGETRLNLKGGNALRARFPKNVPVQIRVVNPDGGTAVATYTR